MKILIALLFVVAVCTTTATASTSAITKLFSQNLQQPGDGEGLIQPRIIDGKPAKQLDAPFIVSISLSKVVATHKCAGSIIEKEWILTAAHCVKEIIEHSGSIIGLNVTAGVPNRAKLENAQKVTIDFAFIHKHFTGKVDSDDIALLHISPPLKFNKHVAPVALPYLKESYAGMKTATYGWGIVSNEDSVHFADDLQTAKAKVLTASECKAHLTTDAPVTDKQICAQVIAGYGDGGSPLVLEKEVGVRELVGITSWAYLPFGYNGRPTVFTDVAQYIHWIRKVQSAFYTLH